VQDPCHSKLPHLIIPNHFLFSCKDFCDAIWWICSKCSLKHHELNMYICEKLIFSVNMYWYFHLYLQKP
jgi:hypothetical protein